MNRSLVAASVLTLVGAFGACAVEEPAPVDGNPPTGGAGPGSGGASGTPATGGASGTPATGGASGTPATGGASGTPATGGASGATPTGGTPGTGGASGDAGAGNIGGMTGGTAGDAGAGNIGGMTGGTGGMTGGTGGMTGGSAGKAGSGGGPTVCPTPTELFPVAQVTGQTSGLTGTANPAGAMGSLEGHLIFTPCADTNCDDCSGAGWVYKGTTSGCSNGLTAVQNFTVGGTAGTPYNVTLHFYGITEPKNYGNTVTRQSGNTRPGQNDTGANPAPWAWATGNPNFTQSDYNTYEIHVVDNNGMEVCSYFLNSDTTEGHWTYVINYERTITVIGGGRVRVRVYDRNCRMIKNCMSGGTQGQCSATGCNNKARQVTAVDQAMPPPGAALDQPGLGRADSQAGQWLYIDVTGVACTPRLDCDGMP